jgi:DNA-binding NtrC family response regulator
MLTASQNLIAELQDVLPDRAPLAERGEPEARGRRGFRILIADNEPFTLLTTKGNFADMGFDVVAVGSAQAARLLLYFNADALEAIVLDGRLTDDSKEKDRSGYALAEEMLDWFGYLPPVIIFSMYEDRRGKLKRDGITFVPKPAGYEVLIQTVSDAIQQRRQAPRRRARRAGAMPPVVILGGDADRLREELDKHSVDAQTCTNAGALLEAAPYLPSAIFVVDITGNAPQEGLQAIRLLRELREGSGHSFYVVALAGSKEFKQEAERAGSDVSLVTDSAETDALEISARMAQQKRAMERATDEAKKERLAERFYGELVKLLQEVRQSPERGMSAPAEVVERALHWPSLAPEEQLVLTSLYTQMLAVGAGAPDEKTVDLCIEGASMLAKDGAPSADVYEWVERASRHSPAFRLAWFKEEFLTEVYEDDLEESDE